MPKPLREILPSSSVARLLDVGAAARAVSTPALHDAVSQSTPAAARRRDAEPAWTEQPTIKREVRLTRTADNTLSRLVEIFRQATGTKLTTSHAVRAVLKATAHCLDAIEREVRNRGQMKLPSNAREQALQRERFEARLADAFVAGVQSAPTIERDEPVRQS